MALGTSSNQNAGNPVSTAIGGNQAAQWSAPALSAIQGGTPATGNAVITPSTANGGFTNDPATGLGFKNTGLANPVANQSTTTLSSDKSNDIAGIQATTSNLKNNVGATTDPQSGVTTNADGTAVAPSTTTPAPTTDQNGNPVQNPATTSTGGYVDDVYYPPGSPVPTDANGNPVALSAQGTTDSTIMSGLTTAKAQVDANTAATISGIQASYTNLISLQNEANQYASSAQTMAGIRSGSSQYESQTSAGLMQATMSYGVQRISNLQSQENTAIQAATTAGENQDYKLMDQMNTEAANVRTEKQTAAAALAKTVNDAAAKLADQNFTAKQNELDRQQKQEQIDNESAAQLETARHNAADEANQRATTNLEAIKTDIAEKTFNATYGAFMGADGSTASSNPSSIPGYTQLPNATSVINAANLPTGIDKQSSIGGLPVVSATDLATAKTLSTLAMTANQLLATFATGTGKQLSSSPDSSMKNQQDYTTMAEAFNSQIAALAKNSPSMSGLANVSLPTGNNIFGGLFGGSQKAEFTNAIKQINQALTTTIPGYSAPPYGQVFSNPQDAQNFFTSAGMANEYSSDLAKANTLAQQKYSRNATDGEVLQIINGQ